MNMFHLGTEGDESDTSDQFEMDFEPVVEKFDPFAALAAEGIPVPTPISPAEPGLLFKSLPDADSTQVRVNEPIGINPKDLLGNLKPDLSVVPPAAMLHLASAMMDGAAKYGPFNWRGNSVLSRVYIAAAMRHLMQYLDGEDFDPTSKVHHLGHAMACAAIVLDAAETGNLSDNRPTPGAAGGMIRRWSPDNKFG